jgi:hypothetical protein
MDPRFDLDVPPENEPQDRYTRVSDWTVFKDAHSGGSKKLRFEIIYIEAPPDTALRIFRHVFKLDPHNVTCDCCGSDYSIFDERTSFVQASGFSRDCFYNSDTHQYEERVRGHESCWHHVTPEAHAADAEVRVLFAEELTEHLN